jgi:Flp pilus assembly protein TadD
MEYKDALDDFSKAIELQPEFAEAYDLRGVCKAELGDKDGACADWYKSYLLGYNPAFKLLEKFCDLNKLKE